MSEANTQPKARYEGTPIKMAGTTYIVPPMNLKTVRKVQPLANRIGELGGAGDEAIGLMGQIITMALQRNYPELTQDDVEEMVDMATLGPIFEAVMNVSGFAHKGDGQGEASAAA